jgi:glycosyltransferase involved in cell wall biosynthesis
MTDHRPDAVPVAIVANAQTPYRLHLHRRIVRETPEVHLHSVFTHEFNPAPWPYEEHPEIGSICFGIGEHGYGRLRPKHIPADWRRGKRMIRWLEERGVRAIVMVGYADVSRLRLAAHFRRRGVPIFLFGDSNIHGDNPVGLKRTLKRSLMPRFFRRFTGVMPCGSCGEAYFERYGVPRDRMFRWPYEPDYDEIRSVTDDEARAALDRFGLDPARRRIVYSGRLASVKRVDLLVRAFRAIAERRPEWDLLLVGDGPLRAEIEALIGDDLAGRVAITGFLTDQRLVSALYRASDVLALPSDFEPWGLVINEAAASGLAIVATEVVGAAVELVHDGENGRLIPPGNEEALRDALLEVTDPARIDAMKAASEKSLEKWRREADPVEGFRQALRWAGVLGEQQP